MQEIRVSGERQKSEAGATEVSKKKPFQLITAAGLIYSDNATAVKEDKTGRTKLAATVVPQYRLSLNPASEMLLQGITLREKYSDSNLENLETVYTQVSAEWQNRSGFGDWQLKLGWTAIGGKTSGLTADTQVETDVFLGGLLRLKTLDNKNIKLGFRWQRTVCGWRRLQQSVQDRVTNV